MRGERWKEVVPDLYGIAFWCLCVHLELQFNVEFPITHFADTVCDAHKPLHAYRGRPLLQLYAVRSVH